ncbi:glycosyltransferase family 4 protein [Clostridium perfringens]|uniref:glycosyltransferase family 4 protein n=1 Tax=Clostridium perfringens TaxID=1502 RepID=UPI0018E4A260|nr:glycosyltransferase family 4 protein [Clostridium perfringens]MBI6038283.1 glycosyltransferase family 4 protein [Clostridium perfringens]MDM0483754.1 glycosyltransferase family 4 protein [Clostridium perfringens]
MRIVHIHQYYNDGMGYQENILPYYQKRLGHEVFLITSNLSNGFNEKDRNKGVRNYNNGVEINRISIKGEFKNRFVIFNGLYNKLSEIKPDYIFHHSVTAPSLATVCRYKKNNNNVFLVADNHADLNISARNKWWKIFYYNIFWKAFIKKYDKFIDLYFGVTPSRCLFLNEELGVSNNKIRLLPIGADVEGLNIVKEEKEILKKYNIDNNNFLIVHGGKMSRAKQVDRLIKAFSLIEDKNVNLILFGKIEDKYLKNLISLDKRIIYLGWLDRADTLSILKLSDVGIWNTQHTTLLEDAIAMGLPMILRYYGSTSHLINESGMFLYNGSTREIYDKLNFIINNKNMLIDYFKKNAVKMSELLSYDEIARESLEYKENLSQKRLHKIFMNKKFSDTNFRYFRKINRE